MGCRVPEVPPIRQALQDVNGSQVSGTGTPLASITAVSGQFAWTAVSLSATSVTMSVDYIDWQRQVTQ